MRTLLLLISLLVPAALWAAPPGVHLQEGDLLFVTAGTTGLSGAIDEATARQETAGFDHVALVADGTEGRTVLHADELGSREQALAEFLDNARQKHRQVIAYRLVTAYQPAIPDAVAKARTLLGKPYNATYVQSEDSYYCSDFIERAFRAHQVFALQPMNFRNLQTGRISPYWTDFYRSRGMEVPQDAPGTNPNDMAASPALQRLGALSLASTPAQATDIL